MTFGVGGLRVNILKVFRVLGNKDRQVLAYTVRSACLVRQAE